MPINLRAWSQTAAQRGWGAGWPSCGGVKSVGTVVVTANISGARMSVHPRIARLVDLLIDTTEARGFLLKPASCGAYNCRAISGTNSPSNHSWALACDINWNDNPYTTSGKHTIPDWVYALWARYGFANGSMYSGARDWMHFEFMGTPADADAMTALAITELIGGGAIISPTAPPLEKDMSPTPIPITIQPDGTFSMAARVENSSTGSQLYRHMWISYGPLWCDADVRIGIQDGKGGLLAPLTSRNLLGNRNFSLDVPDKALCVTFEGTLLGQDPRRTLCAYLLAAPA